MCSTLFSPPSFNSFTGHRQVQVPLSKIGRFWRYAPCFSPQYQSLLWQIRTSTNTGSRTPRSSSAGQSSPPDSSSEDMQVTWRHIFKIHDQGQRLTWRENRCRANATILTSSGFPKAAANVEHSFFSNSSGNLLAGKLVSTFMNGIMTVTVANQCENGPLMALLPCDKPLSLIGWRTETPVHRALWLDSVPNSFHASWAFGKSMNEI